MRGTRIALYFLMLRLRDGESATVILDDYTGSTAPTEDDVRAAVDYCAERRCSTSAVRFCFPCTLRRLSEGQSFEDFAREFGQDTFDGKEETLDTPGVKFLGTIDDLRSTWLGKDGWRIAQTIRDGLDAR